MKRIFTFFSFLLLVTMTMQSQVVVHYDHSGNVLSVFTSSQVAKTVWMQSIQPTSVTLSQSTCALSVGDSELLTATVSPDYATNKSVSWSTSDATVATVSSTGLVTALGVGTATITATTVDGGKTATCTVTVKPGYVDLGLSVKWATCNIGASSPEDYGDYYAWGETETKSNYSWSTYKWCNGSRSTMTKYCTSSSYGTVDNKTTLDADDDVAYVKWGDSWRMPTKSEQDELRNSCTWSWTTQNGKNGYRVTGPNGNSIFLPAAGSHEGTSLYDAGSYGYYWSSSLYSSSSRDAYDLNFNSGDVNWYNDNRYLGQSVRPVYGDAVHVTGIILDKTELKLSVDATETLTATIAPADATNQNVTWTSSNTAVATVSSTGVVTAVAAGTATITATTEDGGMTATCEVTVKDYNGHAYVDLGLPSGLLWATCNIGASSPEDYGDYYAWGETETKSNYSWSTYKWCNGSFTTMTKYCTSSSYGTVDNKTTLELSDDVAHVKWGGSWRMPTYAEQTELRTNCTWTWTTQNGKNGYKVTGTNGNSIFLPAAGYRGGTGLNLAGSDGDYWSSSLCSSDPTLAYFLYFNFGFVDWNGYSRYIGFSVRAVSE